MNSQPTVKTISCDELYRATSSQRVELIDVRTPEEFSEVHAFGARNVPLDQLNPATLLQSCTTADEPLYFICAICGRSAWACELMMAAGYKNVVNVEGGTQAWCLSGLPVKQGS